MESIRFSRIGGTSLASAVPLNQKIKNQQEKQTNKQKTIEIEIQEEGERDYKSWHFNTFQ